MNASEFISIDYALSELITAAADEGFARSGLDKGFYVGRIHSAVTFFALETFYQVVTKDILNFDVNGNGVIDIPVNAFNIREIYLFNKDNCDTTATMDDYALVHWKRTLAYGSSGLKTTRIRKYGTDPVLQGGNNYGNRFNNPYSVVGANNGSQLYTCNIQGGKIILDNENYKNYKHIRLIYNGMGAATGDIPCIPRILYDGILDKAKLDVFEYLKVRDRSYRIDYNDAMVKFHGNNRMKGSYRECKNRILAMDTFQREAFREYFANADFI